MPRLAPPDPLDDKKKKSISGPIVGLADTAGVEVDNHLILHAYNTALIAIAAAVSL